MSKQAVIFLAFLSAAFILSTVYFFQGQMVESRLKALNQFQWIILVQGDQLTIDEAGRYLKQLDGAGSVDFLSSDTVLSRIQREGIVEEDLSLIRPTFPSAWLLSWSENAVVLENLPNILSDIKRFPGVMDVAYDRDAIVDMNIFRYHEKQVELGLALFYAVALIAVIVLAGRAFFFSKSSFAMLKKLWPAALLDSAAWVAGVSLCFGLLGSVPAGLILFGGAASAAVRPLWAAAFQND